MWRAVWLVLATVACRDAAPRREAPSSGSAVAARAPGDAARDAAFDAPADADTSAASDIEVTDDKQTVHLRWGRAFYGAEGFILQLYTLHEACEHFSPLADIPAPMIQLELEPGPGGKFYTGQRFGAQVLVKTEVVPQLLSPSQVELAIEPFGTGKGQHVRGTIDGTEYTFIGSAKVHGAFDLEICDGPDDPVRALRTSAPARAATGRLAGKRLVPRTVQAIVRADAASKDEATDVGLKRKPRASLDYVFAIAFYDKPDVPCPPANEAYNQDPAPIILFQLPGGASQARPILHVPQPVTGTSGFGSSDEESWFAWISFDQLAFSPGARVTGSLWAQPRFAWSPKGEFGGHFSATVCVD